MPLSTALPTTITWDFDDKISVRYSINQTIDNNSAPGTYFTTYHEVEFNITFLDSGDWNITAYYWARFQNPENGEITYEFMTFNYYFPDNSRLVYDSKDDINNLNYDNTRSFIYCDSSLVFGGNQQNRIGDMLFVMGDSANYEDSTQYIANQLIDVQGNSYNVRYFRNNITDIPGCGG